jgi:hypothetical protein
MEKLVRETVVKHKSANKLFSNKQFGFISGISTTLQLLRVMDEWTKIIDKGGKIDSVYMDFMKAFDKVADYTGQTDWSIISWFCLVSFFE